MVCTTWPASPLLPLRTSSMTFSSAWPSACEVELVAATAARAGGGFFAAGGATACWRVAGWIAGAGWMVPVVCFAGVAAGFAAVCLASGLAAVGLAAAGLAVSALPAAGLPVDFASAGLVAADFAGAG